MSDSKKGIGQNILYFSHGSCHGIQMKFLVMSNLRKTGKCVYKDLVKTSAEAFMDETNSVANFK